MKIYFFGLLLISKLFADIIVCGPINKNDGIGRHSTEYAEFFSKFFLNTSLLDDNGQVQELNLDYSCDTTGHPLIDHNLDIFFYTGCLFGHQENLLRRMKNSGKIMVSLTMFESTKASTAYVELLNKYFDIAIVPDQYLKKVYEDSGTKIPIFAASLMLELQDFLNTGLKSKKNEPFVFGNLSTFLPRKNQLMLVQAFSELYGNNFNFKLILNSRWHDEKYLEKILNYISLNKISNIELTTEKLPFLDYIEKFKQLDCYVSLSSGEGFSIQPREAMCLGIPCIVSDNMAQSTICKSGLVIPVVSNKKIRANYTHVLFKGDCGYQYDANILDCKRALEDVVKNYDYYLSMSEDARNWAKQYTFSSSLKDDWLTIFNPKKVVFSKQNTIKDGVLYIKKHSTFLKYKKIKK